MLMWAEGATHLEPLRQELMALLALVMHVLLHLALALLPLRRLLFLLPGA